MSTPNLRDEPVTREGEPLLRRWTRRLRDWLNVVLDEPVADSPDRASLSDASSSESAQTSQASEENEAAALEQTFGVSGPPEAWLQLVREGAPELLLPEEQGGTPWAGIRAFAGQPQRIEQPWIPTMNNPSVDDMLLSQLPRRESVRTVESVSNRRISVPVSYSSEEKPAAKPTLIQSLESIITQVFRRHTQGDRMKEQSHQPQWKRTAATFGPRVETTSTVHRSLASQGPSIPTRVVAGELGVTREPAKEMPVPKVAIAQGTRIIRPSQNPVQNFPSRSEKPIYSAASQHATSVRQASQAPQLVAEPSRKLMMHQTTDRNNVERARSTSEVAASVQPRIESTRNIAPATIDSFPARRQQPIFSADVPTPRRSADSFFTRPQPDSAPGQRFTELPQIPVSASETPAIERWAELPNATAPSASSFADALRRLDHLRQLDREQQGGN